MTREYLTKLRCRRGKARRWEIPRVPAKAHCRPSSLKVEMMVVELGVPPSKTQWLQWIHSNQAPRVMMELSPFFYLTSNCHLHWPTFLQNISHSAEGQSKPKRCRLVNQNWREETHETSRWSIVSSAWSHRGQVAGWGRPLLVSLSAVQHRLWAHSGLRHFMFLLTNTHANIFCKFLGMMISLLYNTSLVCNWTSEFHDDALSWIPKWAGMAHFGGLRNGYLVIFLIHKVELIVVWFAIMDNPSRGHVLLNKIVWYGDGVQPLCCLKAVTIVYLWFKDLEDHD